jgi:long-chain acyl-CoA synthetase
MAAGIGTHRIRVCEVGGDRVPLSFHEGFREVFGVLPREHLGMTEANTFTVNPEEEERIRVGSVGLPLPECSVEIRAPDGTVLPPEEEGEIWALTPGRMEEYLWDPEKTAETIVDSWVATGDAGYLDSDGYLWLSGRFKHIIICDGDNVHPGEVERALAEHPSIKEVCVFGVPHDLRGETVAAAIETVSDGSGVTLQDLEVFLRSELTEVKIPKDLLVMERLPQTAVGKLDRREMVRQVFEQREGPVD